MVAGRPNSISNVIGSPLRGRNSISNAIGRPLCAPNSISNAVGSLLRGRNGISNVLGRLYRLPFSVFSKGFPHSVSACPLPKARHIHRRYPMLPRQITTVRERKRGRTGLAFSENLEQRFLFRILIKILADFSKKTNGFRNFTFCFHKECHGQPPSIRPSFPKKILSAPTFRLTDSQKLTRTYILKMDSMKGHSHLLFHIKESNSQERHWGDYNRYLPS